MHKFIDRRIRIILTTAITFLLITGCTSSYKKGPDLTEKYRIDVERMLREEVKLWTDTPHRTGGASSSGIDCSGFVMSVYGKLFKITLPRDTENQVAVGVSIDKNELKSGDLVFFRPPKIKRHVGIYLSNGEFAHTSSRKGVTISRIDDPYWNKSYWTSRRILP
ncbi:MAG: C40 family peptidase [Proteobacteria bacterium]|nr:C40 family peptidase [Pseudomonadota bacterium]